MVKKAQAPAVPPVDENEGHGGSYVIDPDSGVRTLIERTQEAKANQEGEENGAQ